MRPRILAAIAAVLVTSLATSAWATGQMTPTTPVENEIQIRSHHVEVTIINGFARTEVTQVFFNPNSKDLEALYSFPVPQSASLSEMVIYVGEKEIHGEVLSREDAERIYNEEKSKGNDAGLAKKETYQRFEFAVSPVKANAETRVKFVYYQPLEIDTGIGRYLYPLEEGGTEDPGASFWQPNTTMSGDFSVNIELRSAWPIADIRIPGFEGVTKTEDLAEGHKKASIQMQSNALNKDVIFYYRLADDLPGRVEIIPYKPGPNDDGTFMAVVTPGVDLKPLNNGADYIFVLDTSGSMDTKIHTLARGVKKALTNMRAEDRVRVITFANSASDISGGWVQMTPENANKLIAKVEQLSSGGSTNIYDGIGLALSRLDDDRATSIVLVTDGVTNTGVVEPAAFDKLLRNYDVRLFGFLMGNSGNWPLMRVICDATGGFYAGVSNDDDILGQIMLAKSKITHEAMHDVSWKVSGVKTFNTSDNRIGKVYRGQQLVLFGRYSGHGKAKLTIDATLTGEDKTYVAEFDFPEVDLDNPELERLWAMSRIEEIEDAINRGETPQSEGEHAIRDIGIAYQLVTDETSMVVLDDAAFKEHGIDRKNQSRTAMESQARSARQHQPVKQYRVDSNKPTFKRRAPRFGGGGGGGGALDPITGGILLGLGALGLAAARRRKKSA